MSRSVPLWIGATPDAAIPERVRIRVFERHGGKCYITSRKICVGDEWDVDHIVALCNGGAHSEDNLAPILRSAHKAKTAADVAEKSRIASIKAKHIGLRKGQIRSGGFRKPQKFRWRSRDELARLEKDSQP